MQRKLLLMIKLTIHSNFFCLYEHQNNSILIVGLQLMARLNLVNITSQFAFLSERSSRQLCEILKFSMNRMYINWKPITCQSISHPESSTKITILLTEEFKISLRVAIRPSIDFKYFVLPKRCKSSSSKAWYPWIHNDVCRHICT